MLCNYKVFLCTWTNPFIVSLVWYKVVLYSFILLDDTKNTIVIIHLSFCLMQVYEGYKRPSPLNTHLRVSCPLSGISWGGSTGTGSCGADPPGSFCWHGTCTLSSAEHSAWRNFCIPRMWTVRSASRWIYPRKQRTQCAAGSARCSALYPPRREVRCLESARLRSSGGDGGGLSPIRSDRPEIPPVPVPPADLSTRSPPLPWLDCEAFTRLLQNYSRWRRPVVFYPCRRTNWWGMRIEETCPTSSERQRRLHNKNHSDLRNSVLVMS